MQVEQIDRDAAASGYYAWCSGNPVIPERMVAGTADDHSMVQAFARHRHQARAEVVGEIERLEKQMAEAYQLAGSIAFDHDISGPDIERLLDLLAGVNLSKD